ncbi:MAG: S41 family peptidase [Victivallales bacterium]|nr:S41 family peptidase [Victivallales bacterium]
MATAIFCSFAVAAAEDGKQRAERVLNEVWDEVARRHSNQNFKTENRKLYDRFRPEILKSRNDQKLAGEINQLLRALGQSHISLFPPVGVSASRALKAINAASRKSAQQKHKYSFPDVPADSGITLLQSNNCLYAVRLREGSPAARAGIKTGDMIIAIDNIKLQPEKKIFISWLLIARALLSGRPGSEVTVGVISAADKKQHKYRLTRQPNGEKWFKLGLLPRSYSDFYAAVLPGNIGYIQFNAFTTPMFQRLRPAITGKLRAVKGLIIDMRGNVGGLLMYPPWLAAWCCPETVVFGKMIINGIPLEPRSFPQPQGFKGPLAVLIDQDACSCAEVFAAGMQDGKQARLFGTVTSGQCLPSLLLKLPSGFRLQTVAGSLLRADGREIEKIGVSPDVEVKLDPASLRQGRDNVIEAAREYLLKISK